MLAAVLNEPQTPLSIEQIEVDEPGPGEALIRVAAAGVCHSDLHFIDGVYPARVPIVLGHEVSGVVEATGPGVTRVAPGDRVIAAFIQPCGFCEYCESGRGHLCQLGGRTRDVSTNPRLKRGDEAINQMANLGGFAELALTPASGLVKIPDDVGLDVAALVGCSVMTGFGAATRTAAVEPGSTVAVIGTGGVGLNVIQGAKVAGARTIIAIDVAEHKLAYARQFGATDTIDASAGDPVEQVRDLTGGGVDYAFEAIGLTATARQAYEMLKRGGTAVIVGMIPPGENIEIPGASMLQEKTLKGCFYGSGRFHIDMPRILELYQNGQIDLDNLVTRRYPLDQINEAFSALRDGEVARSVLEIAPQ